MAETLFAVIDLISSYLIPRVLAYFLGAVEHGFAALSKVERTYHVLISNLLWHFFSFLIQKNNKNVNKCLANAFEIGMR